MPPAFAFLHRLHVRFRDCDAMGHVNHAVYFTYFEQCRLEFWREVTGTPSPHARVIIARAECDYLAPAHFGDALEIGVNVDAIGHASFTLSYGIAKVEGGPVIARGRTVLVSYDDAAGMSMPLPESVRELLERVRGGVS